MGMTPFDAVCHAFHARHRRGFSTRDESFAFFHSPSIEVSAIVRRSGRCPFVVFIKAARGSPKALWGDAQVRGLLTFLAASV